jgi:mannitol/fructose-specific phosphotransferase system IIA component (Ntr-type)
MPHSGLANRRGAESLFFTDSRMAVRLSQLLSPDRILLHLQSTKRTAAINEVARSLETHPDILNFQGFYNELLARERLDTTCLGNEIALPHARTEHAKKIVIAVGRSDSGVLFENSNQNVRLMFVLATPKSNPGDYLMLVGSLCRLIKEASQREALFTAPTPGAFIATIKELENKVLGPEPK